MSKGAEKHFAQIKALIADEYYDEVVTVCKKVLQNSPGDSDAIHCLSVALTKLKRFEEAAEVLQSNSAASLTFERAYVLYRLNRLEESRDASSDILKGNPNHGAANLLFAQCNYRLENAQEAMSLFKTCAQKQSDAVDIFVNYLASLVALQMVSPQSSAPALTKAEISRSFEAAYNAACISIAAGDMVEAESRLAVAEKLCRESFSEEDEKEELEDELAIILTQKAYVYDNLGRHQEAREIYESILRSKPSDVTVTSVASNNLAATKKDEDLFDSLKKTKNAINESAQTKLFMHQKRAIHLNRGLILMLSHKSEQCREVIQTLSDKLGDQESSVLLSASLLYHEKKIEASEAALKQYVTENPGVSLNIQLALSQLYVQQKRYAEAIQVLKGLPGDLQSKPAFVSALLSLYGKCDQQKEAVDLMDKLLASQGSMSPSVLKQTLETAVALKVQIGRTAEAIGLLQRLSQSFPHEKKYVANLVSLLAVTDIAAAEKLAAQLPEIEKLNEAKVNELEEIAFTSAATVSSSPAAATSSIADSKGSNKRAAETSGEKDKKKKKKRKVRLPKNFDPTAPIDPERWLPKKQRSYYAKKGKKKQNIGKGTQGGAMGTESMQIMPDAPTPAPQPPNAKGKAKGKSAAKKGRR
eukprot:TRINITY_DN1083_c0_g1_i10.p1 TRINITY_DN1083_c0_g1~~TRINITY_DN1083_c0_g1_i10.p1  ORF type:complete len:642 (-),score=184.85 TRINITY_DN1083_c0_g1_i10:1751-3676(-)